MTDQTPIPAQPPVPANNYHDQSDGPSNQDPDIPDIGAGDLDFGSPKHRIPLFHESEQTRPQQDLTLQHVKELNQDQKDAAAADRAERADQAEIQKRERRISRNEKAGHTKDVEGARTSSQTSAKGRARAESDVDAEVPPETDGHADVSHETDTGDPGPSSSAYRRFRRPPQDVELASRHGRGMSADSSPSDDEGGHVKVQKSKGGRRSGKSSDKLDALPEEQADNKEPQSPARPRRPRPPRSRGSVRSRYSQDRGPLESVLESATGSSTLSHQDAAPDYDYAAEPDRIREFFEKNGYMPAPRQAPDAVRRRLRVIRRLGLERPDRQHRTVLDRFTRLATSIFKTKRALVSVVGRDKQIFLSQIGFGKAKGTSFEDAFCCHTILGGAPSCMVVPDAAKDWRFAKNPLVQEGKGLIQFYAGAPLRVGKGPNAAVIGSMCVIDDEPKHDFGEEGMRLLQDLAECAVSEVCTLHYAGTVGSSCSRDGVVGEDHPNGSLGDGLRADE
jgi:hypothetical protein